MKQFLTTIMFLCCLGASAASTVIPDMKFRRLDSRDGLSNSQINYMFQDSKGIIWVGTPYGFNRYDGYRFRIFYSDPNDTTTLRNNYVDMIWEDINGKFWLKQGMNYSIFDPITERTVRNPSPYLAKLGITGGIDRIYIDSKKNIWVKTYTDGLYCYNPQTKKKTLTKYGYGQEEFPQEFWFSSFAEYNGQLIVASSDGDLMAVDGSRGKVVWKDSFIRQHGGAPSSDYRVVVDNFGNYWVLSNGTTYIYEQKEKKWHMSINAFLGQKGLASLPDNLLVWDLVMDQRNWLWLATDHEGLIVIDTKTLDMRQFLNNKFDETSISENTVKHLLLDNSGNMWIGAYRSGLNQYIEKPLAFKTLEVGDVNTATEDSQGNFWIGTDDRGIIKYDPKTGEMQTLNKANSPLISDIMVASYGARDGSVWFGTYNGGLVHIDNGQVKVYTASNADGALLNNNVWSVTEDKWGDIWIGTLGNGVQRLNLKTGKFKTWSTYNTKLKENFMTSIGWIKKGWLIVGHSVFYSLINPVSGQVMNFEIPAIPGQPAANATSVCVMEDSRELIWYGSTSGCCIVDRKTGQQKMLDMNNGLIGSSVSGIAEDKLHTMWVVTDHGISNVVPQKEDNGEWTFLVRSFSSKDGLQQGPYNKRSISCTREGLILVGGLGGLDIIDPKLVSGVNNTEKPIFSGLKLFGQQIGVGEEFGGRVILEEALNECRELTLRHDENQFTIQLGSNKGEIHNPSRFIYMLEGFSDRWIKTEEQDPNITYMSLHHGSYTLHVRMLNEDGTMGQNEATLKITITPPLLRNRWILLLFLCAVAAGIYFWRRWFMKRQAEELERERLRMELTKKQWMAEMKAQLMNETATAAPEQQKPAQPQQPEWEISSLNKQSGDLQEFMKEQCAQFKAPEGKRLKFTFFPLAQDLVMDFDKDLLGQAIQILLNNSVMFSPSDCRIKVFVDKTPNHGTIRISDNGIGLPEGAKEHMFDPVVSDDDPGVCLHIVRDIVAAHGGTVTGDNNPGGGSVFTITLPLDQPEEIEEAVLMDDDNN